MRDKLEKSLKPIYKELLSKIESEKKIYTFCAQWGKKFTDRNNDRILFVGKATNGWITESTDIEVLFGKDNKRIFDRDDQMQWVNNLKGDEKYNTNNSAFWRIIIKTAEKTLDTKDVIPRIAWSNLYKVSYHKGNPDSKLKTQQKKYCKQILEKEIELFSPKFVVFLTSSWEKVFLKHLNNGTDPIPIKTIKWSDKYYSKSYKIGNITYVTSQHPQGKNEEEHSKALTELMI
jgi:hypothetical protein